MKLGGRKGKLLLAGIAIAFFALLGGSLLTSAEVAYAQDTGTVNDAETTDTGEKVCTSGPGLSGAIAFVLCPFTEIIAKSTQFFEEYIIVPFMTVSPLTTNNDNPTYILWQNFRDLANIGFILIMFISIFSVALSKHNAKRVLSRAFVVAIAINLSYFVIAFVIDAFNVFGAGISQLVMSALQQAKTTQLNSGDESGAVGNIFVLGGTALVAIVATGGAAIGWLFSFLMLAALVVVVVVMILLLRQIAIIMLVILAPIAILLYMLPNTENYFQKWRKTLIQLLLMYPMIVLLFAAGKIFGVILQQPGLIKTGGDVSQEVAEAVRVMLQFMAYVIPLGALPATFAASGTLMSKASSVARNGILAPRSKRLGEDVKLGASEARARLANSNVKALKPLSWAAGSKYRRDYTRESRRRNVQRAQDEYTAGQLGADSFAGGMMRRNAAGVAGQAGQTRAAAYAANVAAKNRDEDLSNEMSLLDAEMRRLGTNRKEFAGKFAKYLEGGSAEFTGASGAKFNFKDNEQRFQRALLNTAADQGEVKAIEIARMNSNLDQSMVDDIIRKNEGTLKGKGGYHLATNFGLAAGRMAQTNANGDMVDTAGNVTTDINQAAKVTNTTEMRTRIQAERIMAMAQSGANSVAGMKAGLLGDTANALRNTNPADRAELRQEMDKIARKITGDASADSTAFRNRLNGTMNDIINTPSTKARTEASDADLEAIRDQINRL